MRYLVYELNIKLCLFFQFKRHQFILNPVPETFFKISRGYLKYKRFEISDVVRNNLNNLSFFYKLKKNVNKSFMYKGGGGDCFEIKNNKL